MIKIVRALHICAHSVAVANLCSKLPEFIAWLKKPKKTPNLMNMAEATMPKGREQHCPRERKSMGVVAECLQHEVGIGFIKSKRRQ